MGTVQHADHNDQLNASIHAALLFLDRWPNYSLYRFTYSGLISPAVTQTDRQMDTFIHSFHAWRPLKRRLTWPAAALMKRRTGVDDIDVLSCRYFGSAFGLSLNRQMWDGWNFFSRRPLWWPRWWRSQAAAMYHCGAVYKRNWDRATTNGSDPPLLWMSKGVQASHMFCWGQGGFFTSGFVGILVTWKRWSKWRDGGRDGRRAVVFAAGEEGVTLFIVTA